MPPDDADRMLWMVADQHLQDMTLTALRRYRFACDTAGIATLPLATYNAIVDRAFEVYWREVAAAEVQYDRAMERIDSMAALRLQARRLHPLQRRHRR